MELIEIGVLVLAILLFSLLVTALVTIIDTITYVRKWLWAKLKRRGNT